MRLAFTDTQPTNHLHLRRDRKHVSLRLPHQSPHTRHTRPPLPPPPPWEPAQIHTPSSGARASRPWEPQRRRDLPPPLRRRTIWCRPAAASQLRLRRCGPPGPSSACSAGAPPSPPSVSLPPPSPPRGATAPTATKPCRCRLALLAAREPTHLCARASAPRTTCPSAPPLPKPATT